MSLRIFLLVSSVVAVGLVTTAHAQESPAESREYKKSRHEFIQLVKTFDRGIRQGMMVPLTPASLKATNRPEVLDQSSSGEPATPKEPAISEFAIDLEAILLFEEAHRSESLGLMALRKILTTPLFGSPEMKRARSRAIKRLVHYASLPETGETLPRLLTGLPTTETIPELRAIIEAPDVSKNVRAVAQLVLCYSMLKFEGTVRNRKKLEEQMRQEKATGDGKTPVWSMTSDQTLVMSATATLANCPDDETFAAWEKEADETLNLLKREADDVRIPVGKSKGPGGYVVSIDPEETAKQPTVAELAAKRLKLRAKTAAQQAEELKATSKP